MIFKVLFIATALFFVPFGSSAQKGSLKKAFKHASAQTEIMLEEIKNTRANGESIFPRTVEEGKLKLVESRDWTSGFFPGVLWFLYESSRDEKWLSVARVFSSPIEKEKLNATTHDMGFKVYCSIGTGFRLTGDSIYRETIIQAAKTLSTRFNSATGVIRSWDHNRDKWENPVIIDNMMNLELLFAASRLTRDSSYYKIAVSHANTTMKNHFRSDYSSYHVVDYNPKTGEVLKKNTHQGYSHESAWSRGQAWALYGFVMCYRETGNAKYLMLAENIAHFIFTHKNMPNDLIPYYDFNAPRIPNEPRDASAAAVIASSLYELTTYSNKGRVYFKMADKIINSLSSKYRSKPGLNKGFILTQSTGSKPSGSEVNVPLSYADYYYLEALLRKKTLRQLN